MNDAAVWVPVPEMFYWGWLVPLIFGTIFGWRYHRDKVRLGNGIWFSLFFYSFLTMLAITILGSNIHWLIIISGTLFVLLILLIGLIFTLQAFLLLWNAWIMWRHESHTLANMLTLYLGLAILILPFLGNLLSSHVPQPVSYFWKTLQQNRCKCHALVSESGYDIDYTITPASMADSSMTEEVLSQFGTPTVLGDMGYLGQSLHDRLELKGIDLITPVRKNMKQKKILFP